jgi:hypothetical protein
MIVKLGNCREFLESHGIHKVRVFGNNTINSYKLLVDLSIELSDGRLITIPKGYIWDLASVPRLLWTICPPDSDAELAFLIHDYLYENQINNRKWADEEMLKWSILTNGTKNISIKNIDNYVRYYAVRIGGQKAWDTN